ncbi:hypothetical protein BKA70DRAFT_1260578 [Coprinopsis sp. MPI-PUGE-AT-0042]|nr:hypothetical protein BKA70DRAFT_1260578 [Coprinopsis sp. MPI-PUGE-AT-0042]
MTRGWEPGTQYNYNDVVSYNGARYKIVQPHRSQGDWTPDVVPALWGRIPDDKFQNYSPSQQQYGQQYDQPPSQQYGQQPPQQYYESPHQQYNQPPQQYQPPPFNDNKYDGKHSDSGSGSDGGKSGLKTALGIAGGLLGGAALLGAGVAAKKHHDHKKDHESWAEDAQYRTHAYRSGQAPAPVSWVLSEGRFIPQDAIPGGHDHNDCGTLFISRGFHKGSITPGKASPQMKTGARIGFAHDEIDLDKYEILVGNPNSVRWIPVSGKLKLQTLGARPVDGGVDCNGSQLYVARSHFKGGVHPGKVGEHLKCAFIPYRGDEEETHSYEVLCYSF